MRPDTPSIILKARREGPFRRGHPWIFSGAVDRIEGRLAAGGEAAVLSHEGGFIAWGLYNPNSQITARLYSWAEAEPVSAALLGKRLAQAVALRRSVPGLFTGRDDEAVRLVFSESDGLSGLTVDYYAGHLAVQLTSLALSFRLDPILEHLKALLKPESIILRTEKGIRDLEGLEIEDKVLWGAPPEGGAVIRENGLAYEVNLIEGHKTGFYLDQRDNRKRAGEFAAGRRCLDMCCYTGAFGLNLARNGAKSVLGVDASETALAAAGRNAVRNSLSGLSFQRGDAFKTLETLAADKAAFDLIVLDPPRFAQKAKGVSQALKGYAGLNGLALKVLVPGGILVTCSCSGRVKSDEFLSMLAEVSAAAGRSIRVLEQRGAAPDHPVNASCPESDYLKCFICGVE